VFGFDGEKTLVSFVPKKNKAVVLLSTMHRDAAVDVETSKPDIILFYNESKGGVDTCDQMVKAMTAKRKTNRWPMAIFYRLLDFACLNSFVVWRTVKPDVEVRRKEYIMQLAMELAKPHMLRRSAKPQLNRNIKVAMTVCGVNVPAAHVADPEPGAKRRCHLCPRRLEMKTTQRCDNCHLAVCKKHCDKVTQCHACNEGVVPEDEQLD
jgi:hypothetical protein